jgi:hypothetical protein
MALSGDVNSDRADVRTDHLALFGGQWNFESIYSLDNDALNVTASMSDLSLAELAAVANRQDVTGTMGGQWNIYIPGLRFNPNAIRVSGGATLTDVRGPDFAADRITVRTALERGELTVGPIDLRRGPGHGTLHLQMNVTDPRTINAGAVIDNWPLDIPAIKFHSDVSVNAPDVRIELPNPKAAKRDRDYRETMLRAFADTLDVRGSATLDGRPLGELEMYAGVWERIVDVRGIHFKLLNGRADGQARLDLEHFTRSTGELTWVNLDAKVLSAFYPQLKDFSGLMTGNARLAPAQVYRPLEPLAVVIKNNFINSYWRNVPFYDATIIAFIGKDEDDPKGGYRVVLGSGEHQTSTIRVDEGTVRLWGRAGSHANGTLAFQTNIAFDGLSLDRAVHSYDKTAHTMPGRLAGALTMLYATPSTETRIQRVAFPAQGPMIAATTRPTTAPASMPSTLPVNGGPAFAAAVAPPVPTTQESSLEKLLEPLYMDGEVKLTEASLAGYTPIAGLYNLMHLGPDLNQPDGTGDVAMHLERGTLQITHLRFFNRGIEVTAAATTTNIWNLPDNPISGTAIGTAQPLKSRKFPLLADINSIMKVIQSDITTIEFHGTVRKPQWQPILFGGIGDELRRFIVGDVSSELGTQNTSSGH